MNSPEYRKTKFSFAAALLECPAWPRSIPDSIRASLDENMERLFSLQQNMSEPRIDRFLRKAYANDGNIELPSHSFYKFEELLQFLAGYFGPYPNYRRLEFDTLIKQGLHQDALMPGALRLLMEGRGLRLSHWLLPFKNETYRIHDGGIVESDGWLKSLLNKDPELQPDLPQVLQLLEGRAHDIPWDNSLCEKWFGLSQAAMARLNVPILRAPSQTRDEYPRAFTQRCAHCHVAGSDAPAIPFAHEGWMGRWLGHSKNRKLLASRIKAETGRPMPPNQLLAPADRVEIFNYLEKFE